MSHHANEVLLHTLAALQDQPIQLRADGTATEHFAFREWDLLVSDAGCALAKDHSSPKGSRESPSQFQSRAPLLAPRRSTNQTTHYEPANPQTSQEEQCKHLLFRRATDPTTQ